MLKRIADLPAGVIGFEVDGTLTRSDYADVLIPALREGIASADDGKVSVLYIDTPAKPRLTAGALWEDVKFAPGHMHSWKRVALVSDSELYAHSLDLLGWLFPGEVRLFKPDERDAAREWVAG